MNIRRLVRTLPGAVLVLSLIVAIPGGGSAVAQTDPIPPGARFVPDELVVQFTPGLTDGQKASVLGALNSARAERIRTSATDGDLELLRLPPGLAVAAAVQRARGLPGVRFAEPNFVYTPDESSNDPYYTTSQASTQLWGMYGDATTPVNQYGSQAGEAWTAGFVGSTDVYVAVTDRGVRLNHPDLQPNIWTNPFDPADGIDNDGNGYVDDVNGWDFAGNNSSVYDLGSLDETDGHGTHVAGTIGAVGGNAQGVAGVSWRVKLIVTKYLGDNGGTSANIPRVLDYLIDLKQRHGLNIVASNNSYGGSGYSQAVADAITRANTANILFVAAAGNNSRNTDSNPYYPASYGNPNVIAVAAINKDGALRSSSNWGAASVDLGAPGGDIMSTVPTGSTPYGLKSGTSMAAPHVTGAAALYAAAFPGAGGAQIKQALLGSTVPTSALSGRAVTGGRLNVAAAVAGGSPPPTATPTPLPTAGPSPTPTSTPVASGNHVGDLNGGSRNQNNGRWFADARVTVHGPTHQPASGVSVSGTFTWSGGTSTGTCTTGSDGTCIISSPRLNSNVASATFSVTQLTPNYAPSLNHDANGDSDGTTVVIPK